MTHDSAPLFAADPFVVQLAQAPNGAGPRSRRLEHVASGRARRSQGGARLTAFVAEVFAAVENELAATRYADL